MISRLTNTSGLHCRISLYWFGYAILNFIAGHMYILKFFFFFNYHNNRDSKKYKNYSALFLNARYHAPLKQRTNTNVFFFFKKKAQCDLHKALPFFVGSSEEPRQSIVFDWFRNMQILTLKILKFV